MHFSNVLKALTGVMAFSGVNAAVTAPMMARSGDAAVDAATIEARELDKSQILKCAACTFAASKAIEKLTGFGEGGSGIKDMIKDVGRSWVGKQACEETEWFSAIGGPFCKEGNNIKEGEDEVDGKSTESAADEVGKSDPNFGSEITEKISSLGLTAIATKLLGKIF